MEFGLCMVTTRDVNDVLYGFTQAEKHGFSFVGLWDSPTTSWTSIRISGSRR